MDVARARKVIRKGTRRVVGKFPSVKPNIRLVHWESQLERDFYYLLEIDPNVLAFREQPLRIEYILSGKHRYYTPDVLVERKQKVQIVEVKPKSKVEKYDEIFRIASQVCKHNGYEFIVVTDEEIRKQPRLENVKLLWRYSRSLIEPEHQIACSEFFSLRHEATLQEVINFFEFRRVGKPIVYGLLYWGILETDLLAEHINMNSMIRLANASTE
jgi:hypothetical protein